MSVKSRTLVAFYDLAVGPPSFDFGVFAIQAEMERRARGCDKLHLVIVPMIDGIGGMFRDKTHLYDEHEMRWRLWNVCIPLASLLGATITLATDWRQAEFLAAGSDGCWPEDWNRQTLGARRHLIGGVIERARSGEEVPMFSASEHALRKVRALKAKIGKRVATMTLRNTYIAERNTAADEWRRAAEYIQSRGWHVVVLNDTDAALNAGAGFGELNLDLRMASYQVADLNLQANNGAASLCWFSSAAYLMFDAGIPSGEWEGLFVKQGLPLGASWPWAMEDRQRLVYARSTCDVICEEFHRWELATN